MLNVAIIDATGEIANIGHGLLIAIIKSDQQTTLSHFSGFLTVEKHPGPLNNRILFEVERLDTQEPTFV